MLPAERMARIREWIHQERTLSISEISRRLEVSEMTVHRDIKPLIAEGLVEKTFGGIMLAGRPQESAAPAAHLECTYCFKPIQHRLAFRIILRDNRVETTCCTHCGLLRYQQLGDQVHQAICSDFLLQTTYNAAQGWYVMNTTLHLGCCRPQVLPFEFRDHAERFVQGFGGEVVSFSQALEIVENRMNDGHGPSFSTSERGEV